MSLMGKRNEFNGKSLGHKSQVVENCRFIMT